MVIHVQQALDWVIPIFLVVIGIAVGLALDRIPLARLQKIAEARQWAVQVQLVATLRRVVVLWSVIAGLYAAILVARTPPTLIGPLTKTLMVLVLASATYVLGRLAASLVDSHATRFTQKFAGTSARPTTSLLATIAQLIVFVFGALIILDSLGVAISPLLTALGVGGLAVALALRDVLANIFSGLEVIASRHVRPGDYIKLDIGGEGFVLDINWRNTTIRDLTNNLVIVPNEKLASAVIWNYHLPKKDVYTLSIDVPVNQDNDLERLEQAALEVARGVMKDIGAGNGAPDPYVRFSTGSDGHINLTVYVQSRSYLDGARVRHEFIKTLNQRSLKEGVKTA
jgi:small-conductance mechanosensitive channel